MVTQIDQWSELGNPFEIQFISKIHVLIGNFTAFTTAFDEILRL